jgi:hypothetical protein
MKLTKIFLIVGAIFIGILALAFLQAYHQKQHVYGGCIVRLRVINDAKEQWALANHKSTNDIPTWDDVRSYLPEHWDYMTNGIPFCPAGGHYTLGRVGGPVTCSIGGPGHTFQP